MANLDRGHSFKVKVVTAKGAHEEELLTVENLSKFDMCPSDITAISPTYAVPGYLYEEPDVASITHPCAGSACANFQDLNGNPCSIDYIAYYDSNPYKSHAGGKPHWNNEVRFVKSGKVVGKVEPAEAHILEDTPEIEIISDCDGKTIAQKVLRDQPIR